MPLCKQSRTNEVGRDMDCLEEHGCSDIPELQCIEVQWWREFPKHLQVNPYPKSNAEMRPARTAEARAQAAVRAAAAVSPQAGAAAARAITPGSFPGSAKV